MSDAYRKMTAARVSLVIEEPFFGSLALSLPLVEDPTCKTAWVDGRNLGFNPVFVNAQSHEKLVGLIKHEVMHCALGHPWRRDAREMKKWNIACDKTINTELRDGGTILPDDAHYAEGDEVGKSSEWIFSRMGEDEDEDDGKGQGQGNGSGDGDGDGEGAPDSLGELRDAPTGADANGEAPPTEQEWKERVTGAMTHAQAMGNLPGSMKRLVQQALKPRLDYRSLLLRFFSEKAQADYTWSKPNTRYIAQGLYLPSLQSHTLGNVAIFVDTSGSMDEKALTFARGIVESVIDECSPLSTTVFYGDTTVCGSDRFEQGEPLVWRPEGGGGTDFRPVIKAMDEGEFVCAVCISDCDGTFPATAPDVSTIWLASETYRGYLTAPFGETIPLDQ